MIKKGTSYATLNSHQRGGGQTASATVLTNNTFNIVPAVGVGSINFTIFASGVISIIGGPFTNVTGVADYGSDYINATANTELTFTTSNSSVVNAQANSEVEVVGNLNFTLTAFNTISILPKTKKLTRKYEGDRGNKVYEMTNHLGNVLSTVSDRKISIDGNLDNTTDFYEPDVLSYSDYYPGGSLLPGRSFESNSYRYGWNKGSEKDDEITGVTGSHITTFFREFDTRLNRTWSIDPVFQPWQSPYTSMDNNPILYNDPMGDTVSVSFRGGFLGLGKKQTVNYEGGSLFNKDGSAYEGKTNGFLGKSLNALNTIRSSREGGTMLEELEGSKNVFTLEYGSSNGFEPTSAVKSGANIPELQDVTGNNRGSTGSGGTISFNPNSIQSGFNTAGNRRRPAYVGLAHELFHGRDANQGVLHFSDDDYTNPLTGLTYNAKYKGLEKSEWRAVYYENVLRNQMGLHYRSHYGVKETAPNVYAPNGPSLLDKSGNPINYPIK